MNPELHNESTQPRKRISNLDILLATITVGLCIVAVIVLIVFIYCQGKSVGCGDLVLFGMYPLMIVVPAWMLYLIGGIFSIIMSFAADQHIALRHIIGTIIISLITLLLFSAISG